MLVGNFVFVQGCFCELEETFIAGVSLLLIRLADVNINVEGGKLEI